MESKAAYVGGKTRKKYKEGMTVKGGSVLAAGGGGMKHNDGASEGVGLENF